MTATCRYNGPTNPRTIPAQHVEADGDTPGCRNPDTCPGCLPCDRRHCAVCGVEHTDDTHPNTCVDCVAAIRADLKAIPPLCGQLRRHAQSANGGRLAAAPIPGGEATVMMSPAGLAHGRAWYEELGHKTECKDPTCRGCLVDASHKDDEYDTDANTPTLILATWEDDWRDTLGSPTEKRPTVRHATAYLLDHLTLMAQRVDPPIDEFAGDIAALRYHLEEVLGDGVRNQPGAPCIHCGTALVRVSSKPRECKHRRLAADVARLAAEPRFDLMALCQAYPAIAEAHRHCDQGGLRDSWQCLRCRRRYTDDQYRYAVGADYISNARALTARELEWKTGVPATVIRVWGSRGLVDKRGRNEHGLWQYDVAQVEARIAAQDAEVRHARAHAG